VDSSELAHLTLAEGARGLDRREFSSSDWTRAILDRIAAVDGGLHAYIAVTAELAMRQAVEADRLRAANTVLGPLHGVPYSLKDLIDTAGVATTGHSHLSRTRVPTVDASITRRLRAAGAVLLGKVALHEFAHGGPSPELPWPVARNPWNPEHFTGSSSSGSGAAVAAGMGPFSIGTDTGGSIRIPAGLCGVAGLKPTYGLVSRAGVIPCAPSLDACGPLAWTAEDCALVLQVLAGHDPADPASIDAPARHYLPPPGSGLRGVRIGVVRHFWESDLPAPAEATAAMRTALQALADCGAALCDVRLEPLGAYTDVRVLVQEPEVFAVHQADLARRPHLYGRDFRGRVLAACLIGAPAYVQACRVRRRMTAGMRTAMAGLDALVTIGPGPAPRFDAPGAFGFVHALWSKPNLTSPFSVTGFPALSVCTGYNPGGLPLSMQIVARPLEDDVALRIGSAYERATAWRARRPPVRPRASPPPLVLAPLPDQAPLSPEVAAFVDGCARNAGLALRDEDRALLHEAAPHALAMIARLDATLAWEDESALVFDCAGKT
jgi:aspartyl-tRNA(Asn)/glutamyl-tRNA(Gln) amidotransferase subunit A